MSTKFQNGRPRALKGETFLLETGCGKLYVTVNANGDKRPLEILARMGKTGGCISSQIEGIARLMSVSLQEGVEPEKLIKHLKGIRCPSVYEGKGIKVTSCSDAFAKAVEMFMNGEDVKEEIDNPVCPKCGTKLQKEKNLLICPKCGFEKAD